jgi:hypothetical protein
VELYRLMVTACYSHIIFYIDQAFWLSAQSNRLFLPHDKAAPDEYMREKGVSGPPARDQHGHEPANGMGLSRVTLVPVNSKLIAINSPQHLL